MTVPKLPDDISFGALSRIPIDTNPAYVTNFRLMIPKVRKGIFFCTEVSFPSLTMEPIKIPLLRSPAVKFFGNKIDHGELGVKFIVNEDYSNWIEMSNWFTTTLDYYGFFQGKPQMQDDLVQAAQILILNNKKAPVARILFDGLMITALGSMGMNSSVSDNSILVCDATFQFTSYEIVDP